MRTSNPTLTNSTFSGVAVGVARSMTLQGTVRKTALLLGLTCLAAVFTWHKTMAAQISAGPWIAGGAIAGLILCLVISFKKTLAPALSPFYAVAEGLFLGALSALFEMRFHGIVLQAVLLTLGTLLALLGAYSMRLIRPSENFKLGVFAATGGIFLVYLATMLLGLFGIQVPYIHGNGWVGIGFSVFVVVIAALNLVLDFDFIEQGCEQGAPKHMEWYAAFGLLVTLVWLYVEVLRLLAKIASSRE